VLEIEPTAESDKERLACAFAFEEEPEPCEEEPCEATPCEEKMAKIFAPGGITICPGTISYKPEFTFSNAMPAGMFEGGVEAGIGIERGVLLTSGDATLANRDFDEIAGAANFVDGDADLNSLFGISTTDATVLEFDFEQ